MSEVDLGPLRAAVGDAEALVAASLFHVREACADAGQFVAQRMDDHQQVIYDLSVSTAELAAAGCLLDFAEGHRDILPDLAAIYAADAVANTLARLMRSPDDFGVSLAELQGFDRTGITGTLASRNLARTGARIAAAGGDLGERGLDEEKSMMARTFRQFADNVVSPLAERIHRQDQTIPDEILDGLRELGCFGLSVPTRYGGLLPDDQEDSLGMIVVTEELSRASLGAAGSLITRPEIMARALLEGGTPPQQAYWLPKLAAGHPLCAIAITEPDYGSDVASMQMRARPVDNGWKLSGAKTWSTFAGKAGVLLTLARTDPDPALGHRGLTLFMVEKPSDDGDEIDVTQPGGGRLTGYAIPTVGYRGMHSFQLYFDDFFVPASHVVGEGQGVGKGFYLTMRGFMGGRIQTAARACGLMQAAFEQAITYGSDRKVFGRPVSDYQLNQVKLARMAAQLAAARQYTYAVGRLMDQGLGQMEASLVKLFACKAAEWITREAMQIHGGMGYAEESAVSRYWLDARVLSIFEGTEETLALKVVGRHLVEKATMTGRSRLARQPLKPDNVAGKN
ncbi:MAG: acyl-CoA dehydrogenase family protein [Pseudomonadota bacterium]